MAEAKVSDSKEAVAPPRAEEACWPHFTRSLSEGLKQMQSLRESPSEMWWVFVLKFLESYAYFTLSLILTIYLNEFGFTDSEAGWIYGVFGTLTSVYGIIIGFVIDNLGVKWSLVSGSVILATARFTIALTRDPKVLVAMLYTLLPLGSCLGIPVMMTGIRRYTRPGANRSFGFSLFYIVMNVAALFSGFLVDILRKSVANYKEEAVCDANAHSQGGHIGAYRAIILSGAVVTIFSFFIGLFIIREVDLGKDGQVREWVPRRERPWTLMKQVLMQKRFWRFLLLVTILIGVRQVFRHLDGTLPKYMTRALGCHSFYGTVYAINPFLVIVLVPIVTALTLNYDCFRQIIVGTFLTGASVFWMLVAPTYPFIILFVITLSIGEATWSPRLYEYTANIAPVGREGTYMAVSSIPFFAAKLLVGGMSGVLLDKYCPCIASDCEPCCKNHPEPGSTPCPGWRTLWLIVALISISSPILILFLRNVIRGRDDDPAELDPEWDPEAEKYKQQGAPGADAVVAAEAVKRDEESGIHRRSVGKTKEANEDTEDERAALVK